LSRETNYTNIADQSTFWRYPEIPFDKRTAEQRKGYIIVSSCRSLIFGGRLAVLDVWMPALRAGTQSFAGSANDNDRVGWRVEYIRHQSTLPGPDRLAVIAFVVFH